MKLVTVMPRLAAACSTLRLSSVGWRIVILSNVGLFLAIITPNYTAMCRMSQGVIDAYAPLDQLVANDTHDTGATRYAPAASVRCCASFDRTQTRYPLFHS